MIYSFWIDVFYYKPESIAPEFRDKAPHIQEVFTHKAVFYWQEGALYFLFSLVSLLGVFIFKDKN